MSDFITLACPSCAGQLRITSDAERFACKHCGREHLVRRQGGHVNLVPVVKQLDRIGRASDRHASELAIKRLKQDRVKVKEGIENWKHELWAAKGDYKSTQSKAYTLFGVAVLVLVFGVFFLATEGLDVGATVITASGLSLITGGFYFSKFGKQKRCIEVARRKLNILHDGLDEIEAELDYHLNTVRVR